MDEDEVLLNVSPQKFEKPKDQLYMDFFVKYTELFVDEAKKDTTQQHSSKANIKTLASPPGVQAHKKQPPAGRMRLEATTSSN